MFFHPSGHAFDDACITEHLGVAVFNEDRTFGRFNVVWSDFKISPIKPFHKYTKDNKKVVIYASEQTAKKYKINFSKSFLVGDRASDIEAGKKVGCRLIFINRNYKEPKPISQEKTVNNLRIATTSNAYRNADVKAYLKQKLMWEYIKWFLKARIPLYRLIYFDFVSYFLRCILEIIILK